MSNTSTKWDHSDLSHRYTVSFFSSVYSDKPLFITGNEVRKNEELYYFNISKDNITEAMICAGQLVVYIEKQGIPYHIEKTRAECYAALADHLKDPNGLVLKTADIVDEYFRFLGE